MVRMTITEEQRTENESRVESDKQLLFHYLFSFLSLCVPFPTHPPTHSVLSLSLSLSLLQLSSL